MDYDYEDLADEYDVEDYGIEPSKSEFSHEGDSGNISLRPPLYELFYHCLTPTVGEAAAHLGKVLFYCAVFRLVCDYGIVIFIYIIYNIARNVERVSISFATLLQK
jgi:hypothetical protein